VRFSVWVPIAVVAALLRCWRLTWGLAEGGWFPDEGVFSARAAAFVPLSVVSFALGREDFGYPTLYGYLAGVATAAAHALGLLSTPVHPYAGDVILVARGVSAGAGMAAVGLVGILGCRCYGPGVAVVAAAFMAVAPLSAMHTHIAATDGLLAAFAALTMLAAHAFATRGGTWRAFGAGAAAGLAFTTKYTGLALAAPVLWAVGERAVRRHSIVHGVTLGLAALAGLAVTVCLACPPCVLHADRMLAAMAHLHALTEMGWPFQNNCLVPSLGWYGRPYLYQLVAVLPFSLGWPLAIASFAGVVVALRRRELPDRIVLATLLPYFVVIGSSRVTFPRYLLPLFPGLVLLAARALCDVPRVPRAALLATLLAYTLVLATSQVARFSAREQEEIARWLAGLRPPGSAERLRVAVPRASPFFDYYRLAGPLERAGLTYLQVDDRHWFDAAPDVFVLPDFEATAIRRDGVRWHDELDRLQSGAAGYHEAARWRPWFLQRGFYTRLDPAFAGDLWQGEIGFTVYVRDVN
jgi:4-amino-4-deoxy-L-arabinose transferase-like glycosyltransferase